jgi:hypothetical protein
MSDDPAPKSVTPLERNARTLVDVFARCFPDGVTCEDLRRQFEIDTGFKRQTFYNAFAYAKERLWVVGGGANGAYCTLNPDGCWKKPPRSSVGDVLEQHRLEHIVSSQTTRIDELQGEVQRLLDWSSGANGANVAVNVAVSNLVRIVGDSTATTRQRLRAAAAVLGYKTPDDGVTEFVKRFLESAAGADIPVDYKIEASELLRKHEAPRVMSEIVRPSYREDEKIDPAEAKRQRAEVMARRREAMAQIEARDRRRIIADAIKYDFKQVLSGYSAEQVAEVKAMMAREGGTE